MSKEKKDILDFLGEEIENQSFEFDASHWDEMEDIIIKDEKKKRRLIYWWFAGAFLLLGVLVSSILHLVSDKPEEQLAVVPKAKIEGKNSIQQNSKKEDSSNKEKQQFDRQKANSTKPLGKIDAKQERKGLDKNKGGRKNKIKIGTPKIQIVINGDSLPNEEDMKKSSPRGYITMNNPIDVNTEHLKKVINKERKEREEKSKDDNISEKGTGTKKIDLTTPIVIDPVSSLSSNINQNIENVGNDTENEKKSNSDTPRDENSEVDDGEINSKSTGNTIKVDEEIEDIKELAEEKLVNEEEEKEISNEENEKEEFQKSSKFSLIAGVNYYNAFNDPDNEQNNSIDPNIGFVIAKDITSKIGSTVGMSFYQKSKVNAKRDFEYVDYLFGKNIERTTIETSEIYFSQMNFGVFYRIHEKVNLTGSLGIAQILNTRSEVSEKVENSFFIDEKRSQTFGYMNGYNKTSYNLTFGIDYNIINRLNVELNYNIGLSDITKDTYYNTVSNDRNTGVQLLLKYNIINKKRR